MLFCKFILSLGGSLLVWCMFSLSFSFEITVQDNVDPKTLNRPVYRPKKNCVRAASDLHVAWRNPALTEITG